MKVTEFVKKISIDWSKMRLIVVQKCKKAAFKNEIYTPSLQALNLFDFFKRA